METPHLSPLIRYILRVRFLVAVVIGKGGSNIKDGVVLLSGTFAQELQRATGTTVKVEGGSMGMDRARVLKI